MPTQKLLNELSTFLNLYQYPQNQLLYLFLFTIQSILESHHQTSHTHFSPCPPTEIFKHFLICMNLYQNTKNQLIPSLHSSDIVNFRVQRPNWPHSFLTIPKQKNFYQLFFFLNLYQHAKKWGCFINLFWWNSWFKNPAIWLAESILAYISETRFFPI